MGDPGAALTLGVVALGRSMPLSFVATVWLVVSASSLNLFDILFPRLKTHGHGFWVIL